MAERMVEFTPRKRKNPIKQEWKDGGVWSLMRGIDFECSCQAFDVALRRESARSEKRVEVHILCEDEVEVQFSDE